MRRWQTAAGQWVYTVALRAWSSRTASTGQDITADLVELDVPADRVRPVPGTSYNDVPKLHRRPLTPPSPVPAEVGLWIGERIQTRSRPGSGLTLRIHEPGCEASAGGRGGTLTTEEARWMITHDPIASACDVCTAHRTLVGSKP
ncbi:DUF6233 domain-containing protein [Streptomyces sp. DSM 116496]|uniref:DUF6233 domain-containing protein n=1 Tax=Streptomyces stoeckheimensis TaxID=3344656 RepID=UPI0038B31EED